MKILLVFETDTVKQLLIYHFKPLGFEVVHYRNPIKAMDNIEEVDPDLVLFGAQDFPRHWKPMLRLLRESKSKEETVFILLIGAELPFEEAAKAIHLGANGILSEQLDDRRTLSRLEYLIKRYKTIQESRREARVVPDEEDRFAFALSHPDNLHLVTGEIVDISQGGLSFRPDVPQITADLFDGTDLPFCTLRIGDDVLSVRAAIVRNGPVLGLRFVSFPNGSEKALAQYFENRTIRELERAKTTEELEVYEGAEE